MSAPLSNPRQVHTSVLFTAGPLANDVLLNRWRNRVFNYVDQRTFSLRRPTTSRFRSLIETALFTYFDLLTSGANAERCWSKAGPR